MKARIPILSLTIAVFCSIPKMALAQDIVTDTVHQCNLITDSESVKDTTKEAKIVSKQNTLVSPSTKRLAIAGITIPSLWWAREQFDPFGGKLINNWLAYPQLKQIDLTVNWQLWTLLDYLGRYRFINQFGTVAREYGYDLRIFDQQKQCLGVYEYNNTSNPPKWEIKLENSGQDSLQVKPLDN